MRLLPDETLDAEVDLAARNRPHGGDVTAQDRDATVVAAHPDHVVKACRAKTWMGLQRLVDERLEGIDEARS